MINSKKAHAKTAVRKYSIVSPGTVIDADQQTGGSMQIEVIELTVKPRRCSAVPVATIATPLARFRMAWRNSIASMD